MMQKNKQIQKDWKEIEFLDCLEREASNKKIKLKGKEFLENGKYPIIDQGEGFIAGYTDAEGTIRIYSNRARLRIGSYDKRILKQIHTWLTKQRIKNSYRLETPADFVHLNGDFYRVDIMDRYALYTTLQHLTHLLRHERRKSDANEAFMNVTTRLRLTI